MTAPLSWYAIRVQSKIGALAAAGLRCKGYEEFLPLYRVRRRWSDRIKELELPLFPGYLFCRCDPANYALPILTTPGVISFVSAGKKPLPVDEKEIDAIRVAVGSGLPLQPWPVPQVGSKVYLEAGPLAGVEGIVTSTGRVDRLIVSISLLQRAVAVEIDRAWVRSIPDRVQRNRKLDSAYPLSVRGGS